MAMMPEANAVGRQPKPVIDAATSGTMMPPKARPNDIAESACALARTSEERDVERKEAAQARAERDDDERAVERGQRLHLRKDAQPQSEHEDACAHEHFRAEAIEQPPEHRAEQRDFHLLKRGRARERGFAPALLVSEDREVGAERLRHEPRLQNWSPTAAPTMYQP